ncbi:MAG: ABC transporter permease [candidate division NC10 bacterium]|jgi:ABC-type dipeptide/oligopeptide/nickel transport system permease component|nr:ABC transporter permease [candidate division NC10 bacterium]
MGKYVLGRCRQAVPVLFGVTLITFLLTHVALGDPVRAMMGQRADPDIVARIRVEYGLDEPVWKRYVRYLGKLVVGDLGTSYRQGRPVSEVIAERLPATARLAVAAMGIALVLGVAAGVVAAMRHNTLVDLLLMMGALLGISTPVFWLGMMLIILFGVWLGWFPISGYGEGDIRHLILPALTLGVLQAGIIARITRSALLEVLHQEYIRTARAKGLREGVVVLKHGLRNGLMPVITLAGIGLGDLLVGAPLTETVFAWPGLGRLLVSAVGNRDLPVVVGATFVFALIYLGASLLVDLAYALVDPRIRVVEQ